MITSPAKDAGRAQAGKVHDEGLGARFSALR